MKMTTLCYIEKDNCYLMMLRNKKKKDVNKNKWVGIGGKFENKECPEDCVKREVFEETGLLLTDYRYCGIVTFVSDKFETEYMHLFKGIDFVGELTSCDEGVLKWIDKNDLAFLPMWEGDKIFFELMEKNEKFFSLKLIYQGENLVSAYLDGNKIKG